MINKIVIPKLTLTMEGASVLRWLKLEGDSVEKDEVLLELETDKAVAEVPSPARGILKKILVNAGDVQVGATVGFVGEFDDPLPEVMAAAAASPDPAPSEPNVLDAATTSPVETIALRATPAARRRARELGVDLRRVKPTGPEGRISLEDVDRTASSPSQVGLRAPAGADMRAIIAERMSQTWQKVPHIHIAGQLRAAGLRSALVDAKRTIGPQISMTDLLLYALARVLPKFPVVNSVWCEAKPQPQFAVNLSFAVQTERGVVAPVIRNAERLSLQEISVERKRLGEAAQSRHLKPSDLEGGTFTLTNLGMFPVDFFLPVINYPQSAILATGRVKERVELRDGEPQSVPSIWANAAIDHRVADGATVAEFLGELQTVFDSLEKHTSG